MLQHIYGAPVYCLLSDGEFVNHPVCLLHNFYSILTKNNLIYNQLCIFDFYFSVVSYLDLTAELSQ